MFLIWKLFKCHYHLITGLSYQSFLIQEGLTVNLNLPFPLLEDSSWSFTIFPRRVLNFSRFYNLSFSYPLKDCFLSILDFMLCFIYGKFQLNFPPLNYTRWIQRDLQLSWLIPILFLSSFLLGKVNSSSWIMLRIYLKNTIDF